MRCNWYRVCRPMNWLATVFRNRRTIVVAMVIICVIGGLITAVCFSAALKGCQSMPAGPFVPVISCLGLSMRAKHNREITGFTKR